MLYFAELCLVIEHDVSHRARRSRAIAPAQPRHLHRPKPVIRLDLDRRHTLGKARIEALESLVVERLRDSAVEVVTVDTILSAAALCFLALALFL
jgi:hypothetical protein